MRRPPLLVLAGAVLAAGCLGLTPWDDAGGSWRLVDVGGEAGFETPIGEMAGPAQRHMETLVGGASAADVDGDGWVDLLVADAGPNRLYMNQGDGTFREAGEQAGVAGDSRTSVGLFLDVEDDGDPDLFLANYGEPSRLLENRGDGTFRDVTEEAGVGATAWAYGASAADVDGDGDLDLSVVNYGAFGEGAPEPFSNATNGERDLLYVNQGDGTFREEGRERGLDATRWTLSHAWNDVDGDGYPDLYVNVDFGVDLLYENQGDGTFRDVAGERGTVTDENGMGAVWTDVDNDLDLDLFATNIHVPDADGLPHLEGNDLFVREDGTFEDQARDRGIAAGGWGWTSEWQDLDHDGHVDAYQANGMKSGEGLDLYYDGDVRLSEDPPGPGSETVNLGRFNETHWILVELPAGETWRWGQTVGGYQVDRVWRNQGDGTFRDVASEVGLSEWSDTRGVAGLDFDRDGDLDLARAAFGEPLSLLENTRVDGGTPADGHWLQVELEGTTSNRDAVGARVVVEAGDLTMLRHVHAGGGFLSQSQEALHVGLGSHDVADELRVEWPSGETARFEDVPADQRIRVTEPATLEEGVWTGS